MTTHSNNNRMNAQEAAIGRVFRSNGNPYKILGVVSGTTDRTVLKKARRHWALVLHPNKCRDPRATEAMKLLDRAFDILMALPQGQTWSSPGQSRPRKTPEQGGQANPGDQNNAEEAKERRRQEQQRRQEAERQQYEARRREAARQIVLTIVTGMMGAVTSTSLKGAGLPLTALGTVCTSGLVGAVSVPACRHLIQASASCILAELSGRLVSLVASVSNQRISLLTYHDLLRPAVDHLHSQSIVRLFLRALRWTLRLYLWMLNRA
ncbi:hypothetical protein CF319_g6719 [Tilletia indica]|nr:hypothetical protein CF319_g6719 [Tilletia indica]